MYVCGLTSRVTIMNRFSPAISGFVNADGDALSGVGYCDGEDAARTDGPALVFSWSASGRDGRRDAVIGAAGVRTLATATGATTGVASDCGWTVMVWSPRGADADAELPSALPGWFKFTKLPSAYPRNPMS
jgi:hypothetical protein